jgi:hypothetical protein
LASTWLTRWGIGALDPTHGQAAEAACALCVPTTAVTDAAAASSVTPAISDLLTIGFTGLPARWISAAGLSREDLVRGDLPGSGLFSMLAPEAKSFALKLKWLELTVNVNNC